jgi:hypothetical protein
MQHDLPPPNLATYMKAYLFTMLILTVLAIGTQKRNPEPVTDGVLIFAFIIRAAIVWWTISLLVEVA